MKTEEDKHERTEMKNKYELINFTYNILEYNTLTHAYIYTRQIKKTFKYLTHVNT